MQQKNIYDKKREVLNLNVDEWKVATPVQHKKVKKDNNRFSPKVVTPTPSKPQISKPQISEPVINNNSADGNSKTPIIIAAIVAAVVVLICVLFALYY